MDKKDSSSPLRNRRKEKFCRLYTGEFWGDPCKALHAAGFLLNGKKAVDFAEKLFDDPEIRARIVFLRSRRAEQIVADEAWIKELLMEIAVHSLKDSDRIRALVSLAKIVTEGGSIRNSSRENDAHEDAVSLSKLLPGFEGPEDGAILFDDEKNDDILQDL